MVQRKSLFLKLDALAMKFPESGGPRPLLTWQVAQKVLLHVLLVLISMRELPDKREAGLIFAVAPVVKVPLRINGLSLVKGRQLIDTRPVRRWEP